jgi:hypothetical protein
LLEPLVVPASPPLLEPPVVVPPELAPAFPERAPEPPSFFEERPEHALATIKSTIAAARTMAQS